jgi:hypothetical protein
MSAAGKPTRLLSAAGQPTMPTTWIHADPVCVYRSSRSRQGPIGSRMADRCYNNYCPSFLHVLSVSHIFLALATVATWSALDARERGIRGLGARVAGHAGRRLRRPCRVPPSRPLSTPSLPLPTPVRFRVFFFFLHFIDLHSTGFGSDGLSYANRLSVSTPEHYENQIRRGYIKITT